MVAKVGAKAGRVSVKSPNISARLCLPMSSDALAAAAQSRVLHKWRRPFFVTRRAASTGDLS